MLIPQMFLVIIDVVFLEEQKKFFLKRPFFVVFHLICDILNGSMTFLRIHRECTITGLPVEIGNRHRLGFYPSGRIRFDFCNEILDGDISG